MDKLLITLRPDGSIMCAEDRRGLLCFKTETETHEQWLHRCSLRFHTSSFITEGARRELKS
jgi:hypothetical protein